MALTWQDREVTTERKQLGVHAWGKTFQRTYTVPSETADSLPVRGELMTGQTGIEAPRVLNWNLRRDKAGGLTAVVTWAQAVKFTGATGTDLLELRGSRKTRDDGRFRYGTRIYAATTEAQGDNIPTMFTNESAVADSGKLGRRRQSLTPNNEVIPGIWIISAQYIGFKNPELMHMRTYDANALQGPSGTRVFVELSSGATGKAESLLRQAFPNVSPKLPCVSAKPMWNPFGLDGIAFIQARYALPATRYRRKVGYLKLTAKAVARSKVKMIKDLKGKILEGWDGTDYWQVVKGSPYKDDTAIYLRIETVLPARGYALADAYAMRGKCNSDTFTLAIYGTVARETFKCIGVEMVENYEDDLTYINYYIEIAPEGWNKTVERQQAAYQIRRETVYDSSGVTTGDTKDVGKYFPGFKEEDGKLKAVQPDKEIKVVDTVQMSKFLRGLKKWKA